MWIQRMRDAKNVKNVKNELNMIVKYWYSFTSHFQALNTEHVHSEYTHFVHILLFLNSKCCQSD